MRSTILALVILCPLILVACKSTYVSASKPNKDGKVVVVGAKEVNAIFFRYTEPRAWLVDVNTGAKSDLEVVIE